MDYIKPNISIIVGRITDLLTQLEASIPNIIAQHEKHNPGIDWARENYEIEMNAEGGNLFIKFIYTDGAEGEGEIVAIGNWYNNLLEILFVDPTPYSQLYSFFEEM